MGALLADQGATVVAVRADGGDPLWDRGKRVVDRADPARADIVIDDDPGAAPLDHLIHVLLPSFPSDHPWNDVSDDGAAEALAGHHRPPVGGPRVLPVDVAAPLAALLGACGAVAGLLAGVPQRVEVPVLDAALLGSELAALLSHRPPPAWNVVRWAASPFVAPYRAADGHVYVHLGLAHHLEHFLRRLREVGCDRSADALRRALSASTRADPSAPASPGEARRLRRLLSDLFRSRPAALWEEQLGGAGLCVVAVRSGGAFRDGPAREGGWTVDLDDPKRGPMLQPAPLIRTPSTPAPTPRAPGRAPRWSARAATHPTDGRLPLAGVRVLDLSQVIAGPTAGRTLAWFGADVLHLEHPGLKAPWVDAFHLLFQAGKRSAALDVSTPQGRTALHELLGRYKPHVVIHNLSAEAEARLDLPAEGRLVVSVSAWGRRGPRAAWRGWEQTVQAASGLQLDYGDGRPQLLPVPVHDLATGLAAAFGALCALRARETGIVEASLAQTSVWLQEHLFRGMSRAPVGRRGGRDRGDGVWQREDRRWHYHGVVRVPGGRLADGLAQRPTLWRRLASPLGEVTVMSCPIHLSRTPCVEAPAPARGAHGADVGGTPLPPPPAPPGRLRWALAQVWWVSGLPPGVG